MQYDLGDSANKLLEYDSSGQLNQEFSNWVAENQQKIDHNSPDSLSQQLEFFEQFSRKLDEHFKTKELNDKNSRAQKDLIKYRLLCKIESNAIIDIETKTHSSIRNLSDVPTAPSLSVLEKYEQQFKDYKNNE